MVEEDNEVVSARDVRIGGTRYEHQKENATWNREESQMDSKDETCCGHLRRRSLKRCDLLVMRLQMEKTSRREHASVDMIG